MIGEYKLKHDKRFFVANEAFTLRAGSIVKVTQVDPGNRKVLVDFGYGAIDWVGDSILTKFEKVTT